MKEKRPRDGKRNRSWKGSSVIAAEEVPGKLVVSRVQERTKEARYAVRRGDMSYALFDPEECLHVGMHDGKPGIVYRFKRLIWDGDPRDYYPRGERGLLRWSGESRENLMWAAATMALERAGQRATAGAVEAVVKSGRWGSTEFWEDLTERHGIAVRIQAVKEVMET